MKIHKAFKTNKDRELNGITVEYHDDQNPDTPPGKFIVRRAGGQNEAFAKALDRETKPLRRAIAAGNVSVATLQRINRKVFIETCLLGWENVTDEQDKAIPFSKAAAETLFNELPDLADDLMSQAANATLFRYDEEVDQGN